LETQFWHVCYLRPRSEKIVYKKIEELQIGVFLPLVKSLRVYKTKRKTILLPLFPGYIFVWIASGYRHHITAFSEVYQFIKFKDEYARVSEEEINNLKLLVQNLKEEKEIFSEVAFQKGKNVEVIQGPFSGMKGKMIKRNGKHRIVVELKAISQAISIKVDAKDLTAV
jgi:transcriptional antiterminator RfaH